MLLKKIKDDFKKINTNKEELDSLARAFSLTIIASKINKTIHLLFLIVVIFLFIAHMELEISITYGISIFVLYLFYIMYTLSILKKCRV